MQLSFDDTQVPDSGVCDELELEFDNDFAEIERHDLDDDSWIELVPRLIKAPERLFAELHDRLDWSQRQRWIYDRKVNEPRLTADYPDLDTAPTGAFRVLAERFSAAYDIPYDGVWVNLYRDARDSTGWHNDWASCKRDICTVPVLTLGTLRRFLVKHRAGGKSIRFVPGSGDLIVMRGRCQADWRHAIPKQTTPAGPRISVNFSSTRQLTPVG